MPKKKSSFGLKKARFLMIKIKLNYFLKKARRTFLNEMKLYELNNKKVLVMGLGLNEGGVGVVKFLVKNGAEVLVTDLKPKRELKASLEKLKGLKVKYVLGEHRFSDFLWADLVIKNPAVPADSLHLKFCQKRKIPVLSDLALFFQLIDFPLKIIAVSGTKGKSTTSFLIYQLLKRTFRKVYLAGNIGISVFDLYPQLNSDSWLVLEISSQQLEDLKEIDFRPKIAVLTNIFEDHLDRYQNFKNYQEAKKLLFRRQKASDFLVCFKDNKPAFNLSLKAPSSVFYFSFKKLSKKENGIFIKDDWLYLKNKKEIKKFLPLKEIKNRLYLENILAGLTVALILKISKKAVLKILKNFKGLPYRLELIKKIKGVSYYNDATATNPQATIFALEKIKEPIVLILGGKNKGFNFKDLGDYLIKNQKIKKIILLKHPSYDASKILKKKLKSINFKIEECDSLERAVRKASKIAQRGWAVLFSPAAASFGLFLNEFDRGQKFTKIVEMLKC